MQQRYFDVSDRRLCAINLDAEPVLPSGRDLAGGNATARTGAHTKENRAKVFGIYDVSI